MAICAGCWSSSPTGGATAYGKVRLNGVPIPDAEITFESVEDDVVVKVDAAHRHVVLDLEP